MSGGNLTLDVLRQAIDAFVPPLYYGLSDAVTPGTILHYQPPDGFPNVTGQAKPDISYSVCEYIVLHPDDLPALKVKLALHSKRQLVPLSEAP